MANNEEVLEYLKNAAKKGSVLGLERITELCHILGDPQNKTKIIHVAGTNGKGSFSAMLSYILRAAGYRVGCFSSPPLTGVTDSFRINCREISENVLAWVMADIMPACESMKDKPTEFEILTAAAYELFYRVDCDIAIIECGMGGDTDSTNVVSSPLLSVITNVALDHTAVLGSSVREIAQRKAGIIKENRPVLYGGTDLDAFEVITAAAFEKNAPLSVTDQIRTLGTSTGISGTELEFDGFGKARVPLIGTYQIYNIANVLTAVELLRREDLEISDDAVRKGLSETCWHGRFELLCKEPPVIFDGAHNPDGIRQAAASIRHCFGGGKVALLIGVLADKEYSLYPHVLGQYISRAFTVTPDNPRALDSSVLADTFSHEGIDAQCFSSFSEGVKAAFTFAEQNNIPLVALGSLYMYKDFCEALNDITAEMQN
ncbi:MAG: bifunctional folylpolyglutamate synthase/dihydrofolate synthase [Ruminococcus sp.]|nr:bifunctional folylpolyglutamate synthase/dihydrofolate synthase [Ruminococcus sp.]